MDKWDSNCTQMMQREMYVYLVNDNREKGDAWREESMKYEKDKLVEKWEKETNIDMDEIEKQNVSVFLLLRNSPQICLWWNEEFVEKNWENETSIDMKLRNKVFLFFLKRLWN